MLVDVPPTPKTDLPIFTAINAATFQDVYAGRYTPFPEWTGLLKPEVITQMRSNPALSTFVRQGCRSAATTSSHTATGGATLKPPGPVGGFLKLAADIADKHNVSVNVIVEYEQSRTEDLSLENGNRLLEILKAIEKNDSSVCLPDAADTFSKYWAGIYVVTGVTIASNVKMRLIVASAASTNVGLDTNVSAPAGVDAAKDEIAAIPIDWGTTSTGNHDITLDYDGEQVIAVEIKAKIRPRKWYRRRTITLVDNGREGWFDNAMHPMPGATPVPGVL